MTSSSSKSDEEPIPFHLYCDYCSKQCRSPGETESEYVLVTNVWNEEVRVPGSFDNVLTQTKLPRVWIWMDDGSTDGTFDVIREQAKLHPEIEVWIERMPKKVKANFFTLGNTHEDIMGRVRERIDKLGVKFMGILDVDTKPCPNYFARLSWILENDEKLGAVSGYPIGEWDQRLIAQPMNTGKLIRWNIVRTIQSYWDFCPDTFYNIKALAKGYEVDVLRVPVMQYVPTTNTTPRGVFRMGRVAYYGGRPFLGVLLRSIRRLAKRQHGTEMLRGYVSEWSRGTWRCNDTDVREFFAEGGNPIAIALNVLKTFITAKGQKTGYVVPG